MNPVNKLSASDFLLHPMGLTGPFLCVMFAVMTASVVVAGLRFRRALVRLREAELDYRNDRQDCALKSPPDVHLRAALQPESIVRILDVTPSLLLTLGILGTFLGLGLAVGQATDALRDAASAMDSLQSLLRVVSFKFQTSAWGVILSLVFTVVLRVPAEEWLEVLLARAEDQLRNSQRSPNVEMLRATYQVAAQVSRLVDKIDATAGSFQDSARSIGLGAEKLGSVGEQITGALDAMVEQISDKVSDANEQLRQAVAEPMTNLQHAIGELKKSNGEMRFAMVGALQESLSKLDTQMSSVGASISGSLGKLDKSTSRAQKNMEEAVGELNRKVGGAVEQLGGSVAQSQGQITDALSKLESLSARMHDESAKYQSQSTAALHELANRMRAFDERMRELTELCTRLTEDISKAKLRAAEESSIHRVRPQARAAQRGVARTSEAPFGE